MEEEKYEQEEDDDEEERDAVKVRSVFKYASPPPSNLCTATNISKSFPPSSLCALHLPLLLFLSNHRWKGRKEDDSLPRESHDNNTDGKVPERTTKREGAAGRETDCEDAPSGQSGLGSRNIFENSNRLLKTTGPARRHVRVDTEEVRRSGLGGGDEGGGQRGRAFPR